ncbi:MULTISPECIES: STAS domain-containing protein [Polymorphospora]|uniref:Anti-sigma factor antagonist n=1 Tax=Polymorphospora lycopeni TaxID=3140240 RepID=A0ABV5CV39_9ACTN
MTLAITRGESDGTAVLRLSGELDMATVPVLNSGVDELLGDGRHHILLDLEGLAFCDSAGMASFVRGDNECAARGGWLRLTGFTGPVERVLRVTGLVEVLNYEH